MAAAILQRLVDGESFAPGYGLHQPQSPNASACALAGTPSSQGAVISTENPQRQHPELMPLLRMALQGFAFLGTLMPQPMFLSPTYLTLR